MKKRLDVLLVERGLADSRSQAQALVLAGRVPGFEKPGMQVEESTDVSVRQPARFVSRGGEKLEHALTVLDVDVAGLDCLDVGASTGGFTDVLLQRGAARVVAVDVGYGQLDLRLRSDGRVTVLERTNARYLEELPSRRPRRLRRLVHQRPNRASAGARARAAGLAGTRSRQAAVRGRETDVPQAAASCATREVHRRVLREIADAALGWDAETRGVVDSGLPGPKGNREFFLYLVHGAPGAAR